jgi:hypothetical protein
MPPRKRNNEDPLEKMIRDSVAETGHFPSLIVKIIGLKFDIDINEEAYDQDKRREIREFVREMSKEIWIDKTYVDFKGTRWSDAFMVEEKWYEFVDLIWKTGFGKHADDEQLYEISHCLIIMASTLMYIELRKYGYDLDNIDLNVCSTDFRSKYTIDERTSWDF